LVTIKGPEWIASYKIHNDIRYIIRSVNKVVVFILLFLVIFSPLLLFNIENILLRFYPDYANDSVYKITFFIYLSLFAVVPVYLYDWIFVAASQERSLFRINIWAFAATLFMYAFGWVLGVNIVTYAALFFIARFVMLFGYIYRIRMMYVSQST